MNEQRIGAHEITVTDRARIVVSGVADVDCFNEEMIVLNTAAGALTIAGEGLHIGQLSLDGGELHVDGRIDSISYEESERTRGSLLRRLFG